MPAMTFTDLDLTAAINLLRPLALFIGGMVLYAVFIFRFYRFLGRKDIFALDLSKYERSESHSVSVLLRVFFYFAKYLILFPVVAFFWFAVLTILLSFLAKNQRIDDVLLISMAVVGAIRVTSYYHEDLSRDLAKILPFALLGVFVIDLSYFTMDESLISLRRTIARLDIILYYLGFIIGLEFLLRIASPILQLLRGGNSGDKPVPIPVPVPTPASDTPAIADMAD